MNPTKSINIPMEGMPGCVPLMLGIANIKAGPRLKLGVGGRSPARYVDNASMMTEKVITHSKKTIKRLKVIMLLGREIRML